MRLFARTKRDSLSPSLRLELERRGYRVGNGQRFVRVGPIRASDGCFPLVPGLPHRQGKEDTLYLLQAYEAYDRDGSAIVICGGAGAALRPKYRRPKHSSVLPRSAQAEFRVPREFVEVRAMPNHWLRITKYKAQVDLERHCLIVTEEVLFDDRLRRAAELPEYLSCFRKPVACAMQKVYRKSPGWIAFANFAPH